MSACADITPNEVDCSAPLALPRRTFILNMPSVISVYSSLHPCVTARIHEKRKLPVRSDHVSYHSPLQRCIHVRTIVRIYIHCKCNVILLCSLDRTGNHSVIIWSHTVLSGRLKPWFHHIPGLFQHIPYLRRSSLSLHLG